MVEGGIAEERRDSWELREEALSAIERAEGSIANRPHFWTDMKRSLTR